MLMMLKAMLVPDGGVDDVAEPTLPQGWSFVAQGTTMNVSHKSCHRGVAPAETHSTHVLRTEPPQHYHSS